MVRIVALCAAAALVAAGCGSALDDSASPQGAVEQVALPPVSVASTDDEPSTTSPQGAEPTSATADVTSSPPVDATEPPQSGRPVILERGDDVYLTFPAEPNAEPSTMIFRVVTVEDELVPFLEIDTAGAVAQGSRPLWVFTVNGGRLSKFSANNGATYGIRLGDVDVDAGFVVEVWTEELGGEAISEPTRVEMSTQ